MYEIHDATYLLHMYFLISFHFKNFLLVALTF